MSWNVPNAITTLRLLLTPVLFYLLLQPGTGPKVAGMIVFGVAAVSDLWDGYLARRHGQITDFGKLMDPLADKLLLAAALVPLYLLTHDSTLMAEVPLYDSVALWIVIVFLGREVLITALRTVAARRGQVVEARKVGKHKAFLQNLFIGAAILWVALAGGERGVLEETGAVWATFHGWFITVALTVALFLTVYSMVVYLAGFAGLLRERVDAESA